MSRAITIQGLTLTALIAAEKQTFMYIIDRCMDGQTKRQKFELLFLCHILLTQSALCDFPMPNLGSKSDPILILKCAKTSQNGVYHSQFLSSTFW